MAARQPPIPPAARSTKGPGGNARPSKPHEPQHHAHDVNTDEQGETANVHQNTTNQGYQQDR